MQHRPRACTARNERRARSARAACKCTHDDRGPGVELEHLLRAVPDHVRPDAEDVGVAAHQEEELEHAVDVGRQVVHVDEEAAGHLAVIHDGFRHANRGVGGRR